MNAPIFESDLVFRELEAERLVRLHAPAFPSHEVVRIEQAHPLVDHEVRDQQRRGSRDPYKVRQGTNIGQNLALRLLFRENDAPEMQ